MLLHGHTTVIIGNVMVLVTATKVVYRRSARLKTAMRPDVVAIVSYEKNYRLKDWKI